MHEAARALLRVQGDPEADRMATMAVDTLTLMQGGADVVLALVSELPDQRARIGLALREARDPRLRQLHAQACAEQPERFECRERPAGAQDAAQPRPEETLAQRVRDYDFRAERYLTEHPDQRDALLAELEACARGAEDADRCLGELARADWDRARAVAREPARGRRGRARAHAARAREPGRPRAAARGAGLDRGGARGARADARRRADGGRRHDLLRHRDRHVPERARRAAARAVRARARRAAGVVFLEIPPGSSGGGLAQDDGTSLRPDGVGDEAAEEGPYTLVAYLDGEEHTTTAENLGDWYDVGAVVGMLNALALRRGVDTRWQVLATGDQTARVIAGPGEAIRRATNEGLLAPAGTDQARQDGRAFEEQAMEALHRQGP